MKTKKTRSFTFRIDQDVYDALDKIAQKEDRSIGYLLNQAAMKHAHGSKPVKAAKPEPIDEKQAQFERDLDSK